jgi:hypothetical protein
MLLLLAVVLIYLRDLLKSPHKTAGAGSPTAGAAGDIRLYA